MYWLEIIEASPSSRHATTSKRILLTVPLAFMGPMDALCFAVSVSLLLRCASDGNDCRIHQMGGVIWRCSISRRAKEHRSFTKMCDIIMVSACMRYPLRPRFQINPSCFLLFMGCKYNPALRRPPPCFSPLHPSSSSSSSCLATHGVF